MGGGVGQAMLPIGAKWSDAELGNEHGNNRAKADVSSGEMAFVEGDLPSGQGVDLGIERCRDVEMRMVRTGGVGMPVVDEELSVNVIEQAILVHPQFAPRARSWNGLSLSELNNLLESEAQSAAAAIVSPESDRERQRVQVGASRVGDVRPDSMPFCRDAGGDTTDSR